MPTPALRRTPLLALAVLLSTAASSLQAARKTPVYVYFSHHIDDGRRDVTSTEPIASTAAVRWLMETYEKHGIKAQLGFVGSVLQLIDLDDPEITAAIKRLKMPIGYHPGSGHREPCQVGRAVYVPSKGRDDLEARAKNLEILWNFETKTLIPKWRPIADGKISDDNPEYGELMPPEELPKYNLPQNETWRYGGWMGIGAVLNVSPMDSDAGGAGLLYEMLGVRSFPYNWGPLDRAKAILLPEMHESEVYGSRRLPYKYFAKDFGEDVPRRPTGQEWLRALADSLPDDRPYLQKIFCHAAGLVGPNRKDWEDVIVFLKDNPEDFKIVWPDWDENQWKPENSAEAFYEKRYGMGIAKFRDSPAPVKKLMADPRPIRGIDPAPPARQANRGQPSAAPKRTNTTTLDQQSLADLAKAVLGRFPSADHDANYGGLPHFYQIPGGESVSLADSYQALARAIVHWGFEHKLPASVELAPIRGPVDYPSYDLGIEPEYDRAKIRTGYTPREIPQEKFPPTEIVWKQGLPMQAGNHLWQAVRTLVKGADVLHASWLAVRMMDEEGRLPGSSPVYVVAHHSRGTGRSTSEFTKVWMNAAELMPAMAQVYLSIDRLNPPSAERVSSAFVIGTKITADQRQMLAVPFSPMSKNGGFHVHSLKQEGFVWREKVTEDQLDNAWNYVPAEEK